jgi:hypothetical protein
LAEALKVNASIVNINLKLNEIGEEGAKAWHTVAVVAYSA